MITDEEIEKLAFYGWSNKGMVENPKGVSNQDVFILKSDMVELLQQNKVSDSPQLLSEEEFNKVISIESLNKFRSSQFRRGMYAGYIETVSSLQLKENKVSDVKVSGWKDKAELRFDFFHSEDKPQEQVNEDELYDSIYMEVVELVEKDNIQCEMYSETAKKLKENYSITRKK